MFVTSVDVETEGWEVAQQAAAGAGGGVAVALPFAEPPVASVGAKGKGKKGKDKGKGKGRGGEVQEDEDGTIGWDAYIRGEEAKTDGAAAAAAASELELAKAKALKGDESAVAAPAIGQTHSWEGVDDVTSLAWWEMVEKEFDAGVYSGKGSEKSWKEVRPNLVGWKVKLTSSFLLSPFRLFTGLAWLTLIC
jgi:hypothetical protein